MSADDDAGSAPAKPPGKERDGRREHDGNGPRTMKKTPHEFHEQRFQHTFENMRALSAS